MCVCVCVYTHININSNLGKRRANTTFDITMGSYNSTETSKLEGSFLLS